MILRELIPRQVDKKSGVPRKEQMTFFFSPTLLSLSHIKLFFFKPGTDDYTTKTQFKLY